MNLNYEGNTKRGNIDILYEMCCDDHAECLKANGHVGEQMGVGGNGISLRFQTTPGQATSLTWSDSLLFGFTQFSQFSLL